MRLLALDTTMQSCSAAVLVADDGEAPAVCARFEPMSQGHAERLLPMIGEVLSEAGLGMTDIDRIAVTLGPGSFTGVRIGVATARGLALATGAAVVGENALRVLAAAYVGEHPENHTAPVAVAVDARRGQLYFQLFVGLEPAWGPLAVEPADAARLLPDDERLVVIGSGAGQLRDAAIALGHRPPATPAFAGGNPQPTAAALARLALTQPAATAPLAPIYLRPPDAKVPEGYALERQQPEGR